MANEKMDTSSFEPPENDEGCENIPPPSLLSETSPNPNIKGMPGLQSTLTPFLKHCNIGNKGTSHSFFSSGQTKPSTSVSVLSKRENEDNYAHFMLDLPDITLLDVTCNSTINMTNTQSDSAPNTPVIAKKRNIQLCPPLTPFHGVHDEILPEVSLLNDTYDSTINTTRLGAIPNSLPEIAMPLNSAEQSDIVKKSNSMLISKKSSIVPVEEEPSTLESSHECTQQKSHSLESSEILSATAKLEKGQSSLEKISTTFNGNLTHSLCRVSDSSVEDVKKVPLQVTQDIVMSSTLDSSKSSLENSAQTKNTTLPTNQINITCDLSTSNAHVCQLSQTSMNSNNLIPEPVKSSPGEKPNCVSDNTSGIDPKAVMSSNNTFISVQDNATTQASIPQNLTFQPNVSTEYFQLSNSCQPLPDNINTNVSTKEVSPESSLVLKDNCTDSKSSQSCETKNLTFDSNSIQKTSATTTIVQSSATSISLQSTFENKPNGTITYKESTTMGDKSEDKQDRSSSFPVKNETNTDPNLPKISSEQIKPPTVSADEPTDRREGTFNVNAAPDENSSSTSDEVKDSLNSGHHLYESIINQNSEGQKAQTFILDSSLDFKPDPLVTSTPMPTNKSFNFTVEREVTKATGAQKRLYDEGLCKPVAPVSSVIPSNIVCDRKTFLPHPATKSHLYSLKPPSLLSKFKPASLLPKRPDLVTSGQPTTQQSEAPRTTTARMLKQSTEMPVSYNLRSTTAAALALKQPVSGLRKAASRSLPSGIQRAGQGLKPPQTKGTSVVPSCADKASGGTNLYAKNTLPAKKHPLPTTDVLPIAKKKRIDHPLPSSKVEAPASSSDSTSKAKTLKVPTEGQRTLPTKPLKHDSSGPSTSDKTTACESSSRVGTLRRPAASLKAPTTKPQCQDCANCASLVAQLKQKDEEIKHLKEELLRRKKEEAVFTRGKHEKNCTF